MTAPAFSRQYALWPTLSWPMLLLLAGCAALDHPPPAALPELPRAQLTQTLATHPSRDWPLVHWWEDYADPQLNVLINEGWQQAPDMLTAAARVRQAAAIGEQATAALRPQVGANASVSHQQLSYNYLTPRAITPQGWHDHARVTIDIGWELDFWGRHRAALAAATSQQQAALAEQAATRLSLAATIATAYAEFARLSQLHASLTTSVSLREDHLTLCRQREQHGLDSLATVSEAESRLAAVRGEQQAVGEALGHQRHRLAALVGAGPDRGLSLLPPQLRLQGDYGFPADLTTHLLGRRPDIVAARAMVDSLRHRIRQRETEFLPNINLSAFIGLQSLGWHMLREAGSKVAGIGPAISLPVFSGGRLEGELHGAIAGHDEAVARYQSTVVHAIQAIADTGLSLRQLTERLASAHQGVDSARTQLRLSQERHQHGLTDRREVLDAADRLQAEQRHLLSLQTRQIALDIALKRALGGGYQHTL